MSIPKAAIRQSPFTLTLFMGLLLLGILSFLSMPQREDPTLDIANLVVVAVYPGASPADMESQVVDPLEEAINELDDIEELQTTIRDGVAVTEVEFIFGVDSDEKYEAVLRQVNQVRPQLPSDLYALDVRKVSTSTVAIMQLALVDAGGQYYDLKVQADRIKDRIESISGVRKVEISGNVQKEVRIALDPVKMTQMGISLEAVERALQSNNANIPGGAIKVADRRFSVKTSGAYENMVQIRRTIVGAYQGKIVFLEQVAQVAEDFEDARWITRLNGAGALFITVQMKDGVNIHDVARPIRSALGGIALPAGVDLVSIFDQGEGVEGRVSGFLGNLLQGILLVGVIIFLSLGFRSASLVMITIPLSILIGLLVVDAAGFALQQMSIAGLVVALGLLVDNSIAMVENIERLLAQGMSRGEAAINGARQLVAPVSSATLTTVLAFLPIIMMPGTTGAFIRALPVTVMATLLASLAIALTLTPLLASRMLKKRSAHPVTAPIGQRLLGRVVRGPYRRTLALAMRWPKTSLLLATLTFAGAMMLFPLVGVSFFPKAEKPQFRITVALPNGSNLDATDRVVHDVEAVLASEASVRYYASNVGHGNPRIYYNVAPTDFSSTFGEVFVVLDDYDRAAFYTLLDRLRQKFNGYPHARIDVREFIQGPPSEAPVAIKIFGDDLDKLKEYARLTEAIVRQAPGAINIDNPLRTNSTDLHLQINREKAMMLGVPIHVIDRTVRGYVNGLEAGVFRDQAGEEYPMVLRFDYEEQFRREDLSKIHVEAATGRFVPLRHLARLAFQQAPSRITHLDRDRTATVLADLEPGRDLDEVVNHIREQLEALPWDEGYSFAFKGDVENRDQSFGGMGLASLMALVLIMGVLIIQFRSVVQPFIIFSALPLAIIGSVVTLFLVGISFSFTAFIGLTSLIGIAINNSIVLVDFANAERRQGAMAATAAKAAAEVRFTPIVLTTLTTILGLLPLTLTGGSLWAPMGWTIIGGLITSTFFVLIVVPLLYARLGGKPSQAPT